MSKVRLDQLLIERNLAESRAKAQALIIAGSILVEEQKINKPGTRVETDCVIRILGDNCPYVSRGGLKLAGALKSFNFDPKDLICLDIGASTGGFTDCLLQKGAKHVIALDVGYNQLAWKMRKDQRVTVVEKCNFRYIAKEKLRPHLNPPPHAGEEGIDEVEEGGGIDLATIDVSFISLDKILPPLFDILKKGGHVISLVKPQFEAGREQVGKGGIVKDPKVHQEVMAKIKKLAVDIGFEYLADDTSQITGTDGNKEFFVFLRHK